MSKSLVKQAIELCDEEEVSNHKKTSKFNLLKVIYLVLDRH